MEDLQILENEGILIDGDCIKGRLINVCHDNLGGNTCLGFVQSFRAKYFCRFCIMQKTETESAIVEHKSYLRTA